MKILLTGGGSGGHFYPIIAIAEAIRKRSTEDRLIPPALYFMSDGAYDERLLVENGITYLYAPAGKLRRYLSTKNFFDLFKTGAGIIHSFIKIFNIYPDVIFGKGGYASFPALLAGRILGIPVVIHESDSVPGRVNRWAGKFATRIAVSYAEAARYFPAGKVAHTGNPIRRGILEKNENGAFEYLKLERGVPVLFVLGGSQGARFLNDVLLDALPIIIRKYQIIHQTGGGNFEDVTKRASVILTGLESAARYRPFPYLTDEALTMAAGVTTLVLSRAGSTIFEIAAWGLPSIVVPITDSNGDHQRENAFNYARSGATVVIEESNFGPHILISELNRLMGDKKKREEMAEGARNFYQPGAAEKIAAELLAIGLSHAD